MGEYHHPDPELAEADDEELRSEVARRLRIRSLATSAPPAEQKLLSDVAALLEAMNDQA